MKSLDLADFSDLLLKLYRESAELSIDRFQDAALELVKPLVPFDSSMWGTATLKPVGMDIHTVHLHRMSPEMLEEYERLKDQDAAVSMVLSLGRSIIDINIDSVYTRPDQCEYRDFSQRFEVENMLIAVDNDPCTNFSQWISFYRADKAARHTSGDFRWVGQLAPHLMQAMALNRVTHLERVAPAAAGLLRSLAVADLRGAVYHADPHFEVLLRTEWPGRSMHALPPSLLQTFLSGQQRFVGRSVVVQQHAEHRLLFLQARARCAADGLTARECQVAQLVAQGQTHKEIAQQLGRSPATIRNHIQSIYGKLEVNNIAELIAAMRLAG